VRALHGDVSIAAPMVLAFVLLSAMPVLGRRLPPLIGALLVGVVVLVLLGRVDAASAGQWSLAQPLVQAPAWSLTAMVELVVPLAITVLVVQNGQGVAVLRAAQHDPPVNTCAFVCGLGAAASALVGAVSTCLTGPSNAMMSSSGDKARHYTAALTFGTLAVLFGLLAPTFTGLMLAAPQAFIMVLAGLAMLRVLQGAFTTAFGTGRHTLGALISLLVTVADLSLLNIGAAFWGLVAGYLVSRWMEKADFAVRA
jgi:benzoate membrane transport protein